MNNFISNNITEIENLELNIDWEKLSVDEIIAILNRIGVGFEGTLKLMLFKLQGGEKTQLMHLVKKLQIGKKSKRKQTLTLLQDVLNNNFISQTIKLILQLLIWRADKKFGIVSDFSTLPPMKFAPAFSV